MTFRIARQTRKKLRVFLVNDLFSDENHTIELRSIVIPRSKELGQFQFVGHLKLSALQKDDFVAKLLRKSYFLITPAYNVKNAFCEGILKDYIEEGAINIATYIIENNATVRQTAKKFGVSKSTVHKDVTDRLMQVNPHLAGEARKVLDVNKSERHIRGGMATKEKYLSKTI